MSAAAPVARKVSIAEIAENIGASILAMLFGLGNDLSRQPNNQCSAFVATHGGEIVDLAFLDGFLNCNLCLAGFPISHQIVLDPDCPAFRIGNST